MKLPGADKAIVDIEKLRRYCLDPSHVRGRHKARVFRAALGLAAADAEFLQQVLLRATATAEVVAGQTDKHGTRYTFDQQVTHGARSALVRTHWIVRRGENIPRLVTC